MAVFIVAQLTQELHSADMQNETGCPAEEEQMIASTHALDYC